MSKPATSQWDFGELFPPADTRKVLSVGELTADIKRLLENVKVKRFLQQRYVELLEEFQELAALETL